MKRTGTSVAALVGAAFIAGTFSVAALAQTKPAPAAAASLLPGGASALSETHGDWTVNCQVVKTTKNCSLSHQQFNKSNGQRLLAIELTSSTGKDAAGTMALPFGLALAKGIGLQIDDRKLEGTLEFATCQQVGCLVPVAFDAKTTDALKAGGVLKVGGVAADSGQPIEFSISLTGFGGALARTAELLGN